jgi:hypothetical protein
MSDVTETIWTYPGWQPIATAPKDGTIVILFWEGWNGEDDVDCNPEIAHYVNGYWVELGVPYFDLESECVIDRVCLTHMTHWMPFPSVKQIYTDK